MKDKNEKRESQYYNLLLHAFVLGFPSQVDSDFSVSDLPVSAGAEADSGVEEGTGEDEEGREEEREEEEDEPTSGVQAELAGKFAFFESLDSLFVVFDFAIGEFSRMIFDSRFTSSSSSEPHPRSSASFRAPS